MRREAGAPGAAGRRRGHPALWGLAGVSAAGALTAVLVVPLGGDGTGPAVDRGQTPAEQIACADVIVEGEVSSVEAVTDPRGEGPRAAEEPLVEVTIAVREWVKPASGGETARVTVPDPAYADPLEALAVGTDVFVTVPRSAGLPAGIHQGADVPAAREEGEGELARAGEAACPPEWGGP